MNLSKNAFRALCLLTGIVILYIGVHFSIDFHRYFQLSHKVSAQFDSWEVEETGVSKYVIVLSYHFEQNGITYHERYQLPKLTYPNVHLAREHLEKWKNAQDWVWYNPQNPHQSSFFRLFPFKGGLYLLVSLGVFFYFLWLSFYVRKIHPEVS